MTLIKRKIYLIQKDFQMRFILTFVAGATVWGAATVGLFIYLAEKRLQRMRFSSHINVSTTSELLLPTTIGVQVICLLIFAGILAYTVRSLWKRFSPPLAAIKKELAKIADGELTSEIFPREYADFQGMAGSFEGMRKGLRNKIVRIKESQQALGVSAAELSGSIINGDASSAHVASLQSAVERMKEHLQAFHYQAR